MVRCALGESERAARGRGGRARTSSGSSIPLRVTMICFGCSSTGKERISAATSSAVFHLASWPRRFWPAHTDVWMILRKSWPVRGLKMKMAPTVRVRVTVRVWVRVRVGVRVRGRFGLGLGEG